MEFRLYAADASLSGGVEQFVPVSPSFMVSQNDRLLHEAAFSFGCLRVFKGNNYHGSFQISDRGLRFPAC